MVEEAEKRGIDMEIYHCGFDPDSLDMLIFRELSLALFDATDPHTHEPEKSNDEIYDTFEIFIGQDVIGETDQNQISELEKNYKSEMKQAINELNKVKQHQDRVDSIFEQAINDNELQERMNEVVWWIEKKVN